MVASFLLKGFTHSLRTKGPWSSQLHATPGSPKRTLEVSSGDPKSSDRFLGQPFIRRGLVSICSVLLLSRGLSEAPPSPSVDLSPGVTKVATVEVPSAAYFVGLRQARFIWERGNSVEKMAPPDCLAGHLLD